MISLVATPYDRVITPWWTRTYPRLADELGFDRRADQAAAEHLDALLGQNGLEPLPLERLALHGGAVIAGAADRLSDDLEDRPLQETEVLIVADGALKGILAHHGRPHLIVTDLDGDPRQLRVLNEAGVPLAVHAHGDNIHLLDEWVPRFKGPLVATRQTPGDAPQRVHCPGGFADGDRAVFLAARLGARRIRLVGFDLYGPPGKASPTHIERKKRKMRWSARLLGDARHMGLPLEDDEDTGPAT